MSGKPLHREPGLPVAPSCEACQHVHTCAHTCVNAARLWGKEPRAALSSDLFWNLRCVYSCRTSGCLGPVQIFLSLPLSSRVTETGPEIGTIPRSCSKSEVEGPGSNLNRRGEASLQLALPCLPWRLSPARLSQGQGACWKNLEGPAQRHEAVVVEAQAPAAGGLVSNFGKGGDFLAHLPSHSEGTTSRWVPLFHLLHDFKGVGELANRLGPQKALRPGNRKRKKVIETPPTVT